MTNTSMGASGLNNLYLDADVLVGLNVQIDVHHTNAILLLSTVAKMKPPPSLYVGFNILLEAFTMISQRERKQQAQKLQSEVRSGRYTIIIPDEELIDRAEELFFSIPSKNVSYSDCMSFAIMEKYKIEYVLSFDIHFKKQGFRRIGID